MRFALEKLKKRKGHVGAARSRRNVKLNRDKFKKEVDKIRKFKRSSV